MRFMFIIVGIFAILYIIGYYALIKPMLSNLSLRYRIFGALFMLCNFASIILYILLRREDVPNLVTIILSVSILVVLLLFSAGVVNIVFLLIYRKSPKHRILCARILFVLAIFCVLFGVYGASRMPQITTQDIFVERLNNDITILQIADLHLSKLISAKKVADIVSLANATNPDIIVLVGDIIDAEESEITDLLAELQHLRATFGVYYVLGNHEYMHNANKILKIIQNLGIHTLVNESVVIDENINLVGIGDLSGERMGYLKPDINMALRDIDSTLPTILLSHQPNVIHMLSPKQVDVVLSGHTHGGQIVPFSFFVYLMNPFLYGLKTINDIQLYITQGASVAVTYGRLGTRQEINLITLKKYTK